MNEALLNQAELIADFFENYPSEDIYDDIEACNTRLTKMRDAVIGLRMQAIKRHSVAELHTVHTLDIELQGIFNVLRTRAAQKALGSGIQISSSMPPPDSKAWQK